MTHAVDAATLAREERSDLVDFLATLTPEQWDSPTLCDGWCVRDVVVHLFGYEDLGLLGLAGGFISGGRLRCALDFAPTAPPLRARKRVRGLELVATDIGWRSGEGPRVEGPAEALLMAIAGRPVALAELSGPGQTTLAQRMS